MKPPIAIFAYNRPAHLRACLEFLERSQKHLTAPLPATIYIDAPKTEGEAPLVEETVTVAKECPFPATVIERPSNLGFSNITEGISEQCEVAGRVIVIEDDVLVSPDFLPYMVRGLDFYAEDARVFGLSGFMYFGEHPAQPELFFLPYAFIWGWATWKRAWDFFDRKPAGWEAYLKKHKRWINCYGAFPFAKMMEKGFDGTWDTWDVQWQYNVIRNNGLFLSPYRSMVWNCGSGGGTHGDPAKDKAICLSDREQYIHGDMEMTDFTHPRLSPKPQFPSKVGCDRRAMRLLAISLLRERMLKEPHKYYRLLAKLWVQKLLYPFTRRRS